VYIFYTKCSSGACLTVGDYLKFEMRNNSLKYKTVLANCTARVSFTLKNDNKLWNYCVWNVESSVPRYFIKKCSVFWSVFGKKWRSSFTFIKLVQEQSKAKGFDQRSIFWEMNCREFCSFTSFVVLWEEKGNLIAYLNIKVFFILFLGSWQQSQNDNHNNNNSITYFRVCVSFNGIFPLRLWTTSVHSSLLIWITSELC